MNSFTPNLHPKSYKYLGLHYLKRFIADRHERRHNRFDNSIRIYCRRISIL